MLALSLIASGSPRAAEVQVAAPGQSAKLLPLGRVELQGAVASDKFEVSRKLKYPGDRRKTYLPHPTCAFEGGMCGAVRRDGSIAVPPEWDWTGEFSEGRAIVMRARRYGFVSDKGRVIAAPNYDRVGPFQGGFAQVILGDKMGLVDQVGREAVPPKDYGYAAPFGPDTFWVSKDRKICEFARLERTDGSIRTSLSGCQVAYAHKGIEFNRELGGGTTVIEQWVPDGNMALVGRNGAIVRPPYISALRQMKFGNLDLMWARGASKWGLMRNDGRWLVEPQFEDVQQINEGLAPVKRDGKWGYVDRRGRLVIASQFERVTHFENGHAMAWRGDRMGYIDRRGRWIVEPKFDFGSFFTGDFSAAKEGKKWGMIDRSGKWVIPPKYDLLSHWKDRMTKPRWILRDGEKNGIADETGKVELEPVFDSGNPSKCSKGRYQGTIKGQSVQVGRDGKPLAPSKGELHAVMGCNGPHVYKLER